MGLDLTILTPGQIAGLAALAALGSAFVGGVFALVTASVNGWNSRRQNREEAIRRYRLEVVGPLMETARNRVNMSEAYVAFVPDGESFPSHKAMLKDFYAKSPMSRPAIGIACPLPVRESVIVLFESDRMFFGHLSRPDPPTGNCAQCAALAHSVYSDSLATLRLLEDFVFRDKSPWDWLYRRNRKFILEHRRTRFPAVYK